MKRIIALLSAVVLLLSGCGVGADSGKIKICATIFPYYDFARAVVGNSADLSLLIPAGSDMHAFEPTARDIVNIAQSDIFIYNGGESDSWVKKILENIDTEKTRVIKMTEYIPLSQNGNGEYDEHIWTSPQNAQKSVTVIADAVCRTDEKNSQQYEKNAQDYKYKIDVLADKTEKIVNTAKNKKIIVADRFPLKYFAEYYGISFDAAFGGCEHDTDVGIGTVTRLIEQIKKERLSAVYKIELSSGNIARAVAEETGAQLLELHSAHNVAATDFKNGVTYTAIMERNAEALQKGLN